MHINMVIYIYIYIYISIYTRLEASTRKWAGENQLQVQRGEAQAVRDGRLGRFLILGASCWVGKNQVLRANGQNYLQLGGRIEAHYGRGRGYGGMGCCNHELRGWDVVN
jgi:hypothetical protein